MRTGIDFFDRHDPKPGDLWVVVGGTSSGKSSVVRAIAHGLAQHTDGHFITYWDLEHTGQTWKAKMEQLGPVAMSSLRYRNQGEVSEAGPNCEAIIIDPLDLFIYESSRDLGKLRRHLVCSGKLGVVSVHLDQKLAGRIRVEEPSPDTLLDIVPEEITAHASAVFVTTNEHRNGPYGRLRVDSCKSPRIIPWPHASCVFVQTDEGAFHPL